MRFPSNLSRALALGLLGASFLSAGAAAPPILPFSGVRAGMKGTGRTVFQGETVETFQVEIVGLLPDIGPGQDLILARCSGGPLAQTGILAGMSGSPIFVDGQLIGALAYSWGFAKEAIAGITPIEEMLAVGRRDAPARRSARPSASLPWTEARRRLDAVSGIPAFLGEKLAAMRPALGASSSSIPLSVSGLGSAGLERIAADLARAGFLPFQTSASGAKTAPPSLPFEPGSAVGVKLVRGDVDMTATGTVTWVDGDALYAFGHPLYGLGDVDLPLTAARVETLLPSLAQSAKIAIPLREAGAFRQDRASAIFGRLGTTSAMIPVRLQLVDASGERRSYAFDLVDDPLVSPLLLYSAVNGIMGTVERTFGSATVRLREGSVIKVEGSDDVRLDNFFAGDGAAVQASGLSAFLLYLVMNNEWSMPKVQGVNLLVEFDREPRVASVRRVTLDRYRVKAGGTVAARILVSPFRGADQLLTRIVEIPEETPPGPLVIQVGSAAAINRGDDVDGPVNPRDLDQLVFLINRLRRNDKLYIVASRGDSGAFLGGARLPNLPPSVATLLSRPRSWGNYAAIPERGVLEDEIPAEAAVEGFARVAIEVEAP